MGLAFLLATHYANLSFIILMILHFNKKYNWLISQQLKRCLGGAMV